jgi:hypothetical protein
MNKKRSRSEHKKRNSRQNLSKTKRRQSSNKKGALKGIHNNKTKANKLRRIVQRGGGTYDELVKVVKSGNVTDVIRILKFGGVAHFNNYRPEDNTVLYTACRSPNPNLGMVQLLLERKFFPNIPNGQNGSYPQHGVVAAANQILGNEQLSLEQKNEKLIVLKDILEELRRKGADMSLKNRLKNGAEYTAYTEYSDMFGQEPTPSIEDNISRFNADLSSRIKELLRPLPGPPPGPPPGYGPPAHAMGYGAPPHAMGYGAPPPGYGAPSHAMGYGAPSHAMGYGPSPPGYGAPPPHPMGYSAPPHVHIVTGKASSFYPEFYSKFQGEPNKLQSLQDSSNYQRTNNGKSYFTYKGVSYYFSDNIQTLLQQKISGHTVQRGPIIGGHFKGYYVFVIDGQDNITFNFYILNHSSTPADNYVSFQVDPENWVQDAPLTLVEK